MEILFEIFQDLPRQGPGCNEATARAFNMLTALPDEPRILDVGCGCGMQTIELARVSHGHIIALDCYGPYLKDLEQKAEAVGLRDHITTVRGSMFEMAFAEKSFDIIWAEGSLYIMGFANGLKRLKRFLKPRGYFIVTELTWLKENPSREAVQFFEKEYPDIKTIAENVAVIKENGYMLIDNFTLPRAAWWNNYYTPLEKRIPELWKKYKNNADGLAILRDIAVEIELYRNYSDAYGYVFFIMQAE